MAYRADGDPQLWLGCLICLGTSLLSIAGLAFVATHWL
jgi:hypothetical protein